MIKKIYKLKKRNKLEKLIQEIKFNIALNKFCKEIGIK